MCNELPSKESAFLVDLEEDSLDALQLGNRDSRLVTDSKAVTSLSAFSRPSITSGVRLSFRLSTQLEHVGKRPEEHFSRHGVIASESR